VEATDVPDSPTAARGFLKTAKRDLPRVLRAYIELRLDFANLLQIVRGLHLCAEDRDLVNTIERDHRQYLEGAAGEARRG
jgi:hypothetical protein